MKEREKVLKEHINGGIKISSLVTNGFKMHEIDSAINDIIDPFQKSEYLLNLQNYRKKRNQSSRKHYFIKKKREKIKIKQKLIIKHLVAIKKS